MIVAKEYVQQQIKIFKQRYEREQTFIDDYGFDFFIEDRLQDAYKHYFMLREFESILNEMVEYEGIAPNKEDVKKNLALTIKSYEKELLSGRVIPYSTSPMRNIKALWRYELLPVICKEIRHIISLM